MTLRRWIAIAVFALLVGAVPLMAQIFLPGSVTPPPAMPDHLGNLNERIAKKTGLTEKQVDAVLRELGPAVADRLASGKGFELQGVGSFRVIRIAAHRELVGNYQAIQVPARNTVQFVPVGDFDATLNRPGAVQGFPVGEPNTNPIPNRVPSLKVGPTRVPERFP